MPLSEIPATSGAGRDPRNERGKPKSEIAITRALTIPMREIDFRTSRSGGPGGQNVNKTETKVELIFNVQESPSLTWQQRDVLLRMLASRLDTLGQLHVVCSEARSQLQNKSRAIAQFAKIISLALKPRKRRVATAPTKASKERRIKEKKHTGQIKKLRNRRIEE